MICVMNKFKLTIVGIIVSLLVGFGLTIWQQGIKIQKLNNDLIIAVNNYKAYEHTEYFLYWNSIVHSHNGTSVFLVASGTINPQKRSHEICELEWTGDNWKNSEFHEKWQVCFSWGKVFFLWWILFNWFGRGWILLLLSRWSRRDSPSQFLSDKWKSWQ